MAIQITDNDLKFLKEKYPDNLEEILKKIDAGYPIQYLIGHVNFYGYQINVNEDVLIPRFETEYLVDDTIKLIKKYNLNNPKILDLATGSGCISIVLNKELPSSTIDAIDISTKALDQALENIKLNNANVKLECKDILNDDFEGKYDVIISNPPYVSYNDPVDEKIKYEPLNAIYAADDGLLFYKHIAKIAKNTLKEQGIIALEVGYNQGDKVKKIFLPYFPSANIIIKKDYNNFDRYVYILVNL